MSTKSRKNDHIKICLEEDVDLKLDAFRDIELVHQALPGLDFDQVDTSCKFLGKELDAPVIISSMTGGTEKAQGINENLAKAAERTGIGLALGSQRAALEDGSLSKTYDVREYFDGLLVSNIGVVQFNYGCNIKHAKKAVDMVKADALYLHANPLQEIIQPEGDTNWKGLIEKINNISKNLDIPVLVKEVGSGISKEIVSKLNVDVIDVAGKGGTSWALIEHYRNNNSLGEKFKDWGINTCCSILEVRNADKKIIASGGIRNGIQMAKAISLGAELCGIGLPLLSPAMKGTDAVINKLDTLVKELKVAMFLTGSENVKELKDKSVIRGDTREYMNIRGLR